MSGGVLYDLSAGQALEVPDSLKQLLAKAVDTHEVAIGSPEWEALRPFVTAGLGEFYGTPVVAEAFECATDRRVLGLYEPPLIIRGVFIQFGGRCQFRCPGCETSNGLTWKGCNTCEAWPGVAPTARLSRATLHTVIETLVPLEVRSVVISGGDPLEDADGLGELVRELRTALPEVSAIVTSPGRALSRPLALVLAESRTALNLVRVIVDGEYINDVTLDRLLQQCADHGIRSYVTTLNLSGPTPPKKPSPVETAGDLSSLTSERLITDGDGFGALRSLNRDSGGIGGGLKPEDLFQRQRVNLCLHGLVAIAADATLRPCPMLVRPVGNALPDGLHEVFKRRLLEPFWRLTKDQLRACQGCRYRYSCATCTAADLASPSLAAGGQTCPYHFDLSALIPRLTGQETA